MLLRDWPLLRNVQYVALALLASPSALAQDPVFESQVLPIFEQRCSPCHTEQQRGRLNLASLEGIAKGGVSGPAVDSAQPSESLILRRIRGRDALPLMPPGERLSDAEIASIRGWIIAGGALDSATSAPGPPSATIQPGPDGDTKQGSVTPRHQDHWAFAPVRPPPPPPVADPTWISNSIDRYVLANLESKGLRPTRFADKLRLIRRATLDLTGVPPTREEVDSFLADHDPLAFARVVDRLLASPRYGERWGRHWLDVARYADDQYNPIRDEPLHNAYRYRDWVVDAFNDDMPFDMFVRAQIAGDSLDDERHVAGLGFYALRPQFQGLQDDRVDATTRGFLGLTVECAKCHDHKYDPITMADHYALRSIFQNTKSKSLSLATASETQRFDHAKRVLDRAVDRLKKFDSRVQHQVAELLAERTSDFLMASRGLRSSSDLDAQTLSRWKTYLAQEHHDHSLLNSWKSLEIHADVSIARSAADTFQEAAIRILREKIAVDLENQVRLANTNRQNEVANTETVSLPPNEYFLWRDLFADKKPKYSKREFPSVYHYDPEALERFLGGLWSERREQLVAHVSQLTRELGTPYPFLHTITDVDEPTDGYIWLRGDYRTLGKRVNRRYIRVLSPEGLRHFNNGSGRRELAELVASRDNPLTARVFVNRVWFWHFGNGLVPTPGDFGLRTPPPKITGLLDYLAHKFMSSGWSVKSLHREIMLSSTYRLDSVPNSYGGLVDDDAPQDLHWRFTRRRLDAEALRDSILFVSGRLDSAVGGRPERGMSCDKSTRRTLYCTVTRRRLDPYLLLFDFPNPMVTADRRIRTEVATQRLFLLNSSFMRECATALERRTDKHAGVDRLVELYRLLFGRAPKESEVDVARDSVLDGSVSWRAYGQLLLTSNEFLFLE